jgi:hypothetical protein
LEIEKENQKTEHAERVQMNVIQQKEELAQRLIEMCRQLKTFQSICQEEQASGSGGHCLAN